MGIVLEILILGKMERSSLPVVVRYIMPVSQLPHDEFIRSLCDVREDGEM